MMSSVPYFPSLNNGARFKSCSKTRLSFETEPPKNPVPVILLAIMLTDTEVLESKKLVLFRTSSSPQLMVTSHFPLIPEKELTDTLPVVVITISFRLDLVVNGTRISFELSLLPHVSEVSESARSSTSCSISVTVSGKTNFSANGTMSRTFVPSLLSNTCPSQHTWNSVLFETNFSVFAPQKHPMVLIFSGITICVAPSITNQTVLEVSLTNRTLSTSWIAEPSVPISRLDSFIQPVNKPAKYLSCVTIMLREMETLTSSVQSLNALVPIDNVPLPSILTALSILHPLNAFVPMDVMVLGKIISSTYVPENALSPILVIADLLMSTEERNPADMKQFSGISTVTFSSKTSEFIVEHVLNTLLSIASVPAFTHTSVKSGSM